MSRTVFLSLALPALLAAGPRTDYYGDPLPKGAVARMGMATWSRSEHGGSDLAFSADGKSLVTVDADAEVRVWEVASGELRRRQRLAWKPQEKSRMLEWIALAPGGGRVAAWDHHRIYVFDTATGRELGRLDAVSTGSFVPLLPTFSPDGKTLFVQRETDLLRPVDKYLWEIGADGGRPRLRELSGFEHPYERVEAVAFSPDGRRLVGIAGGLRVWDAETGREVGQRDEAYGQAHCLRFAPDGETLALLPSSAKGVDLLDAATRKKLATLKPPEDDKDGWFGDPAFSADGRLLAVRYFLNSPPNARSLFLWDVRGRKLLRRLPDVGQGRKVVFSPDGKVLACRGDNHEILLLDAATGRRRGFTPNHRGAVLAVAVSADGRTIASGGKDGELRLWDAATGRPLRTWKVADEDIRYCWFAPDGRRLVSLDGKGRLAAWDTTTGKPQWRETVPREWAGIEVGRFSADGKCLFLAARLKINETWIHLSAWDAETGKLLRRRAYPAVERTWEHLSPHVDKAVFAPDGESMFGRHGIEEIATGRIRVALADEVGSPAAFSPDGRYLIARLWKPRKVKEGVFTPYGLTLRETATGEEVCRWETDRVDYLAFTPEGRAVVAANNNELCVWDAATGRCCHRMTWMTWPQWEESLMDYRPTSWAVLPGGRLATGMMGIPMSIYFYRQPGTVFVWDLAPSTWPAPKAAGKLGPPALAARWSDLAGDARAAHRTIAELSAAPSAAVPFLKERLRTAAVDTVRIEKLLADLDSDKYQVREAASRELAKERYHAEPILRRVLEGKPSLEARRRVEALLDGPRRPPAEALRALRAIEVLERAGTPEARRVLETLAGGADAPETRAAKDALRRLDRR